MPELEIRPVTIGDAAALAPLLEQLGYPATVDEIRARLEGLDATATVLVASKTALIGFVAVAITNDFIAGRRATIRGLVVAECSRGTGFGAALLAAAERWAFERGAGSIGVRSNVIRGRAHAFYERNGYRRIKSQHIFDKSLR